jgi:hypothetical protein
MHRRDLEGAITRAAGRYQDARIWAELNTGGAGHGGRGLSALLGLSQFWGN